MVASDAVIVRVTVTVCVDPTDEGLLATISASDSSLSVTDVVRSEIESNLESVSYVRHVSIE